MATITPFLYTGIPETQDGYTVLQGADGKTYSTMPSWMLPQYGYLPVPEGSTPIAYDPASGTGTANIGQDKASVDQYGNILNYYPGANQGDTGGLLSTLWSDQVKPALQGAGEFATSPEALAVLSGGLGANYALAGDILGGASATGAGTAGGMNEFLANPLGLSASENAAIMAAPTAAGAVSGAGTAEGMNEFLANPAGLGAEENAAIIGEPAAGAAAAGAEVGKDAAGAATVGGELIGVPPGGGAGVGGAAGGASMPVAGTSGLAAAGESQPILSNAAVSDFNTGAPDLSAGFPSGAGGGGGLDYGSGGEVYPGAAGPTDAGAFGGVDDPNAWEKAKTIGGKLLDKIIAQPLPAASLGLMGVNAINQRKTAGAVPAQLRSIAAPSAAQSAALLDEAKTGPLAGVPAKLIDQATTGPAATEAASLLDQSKTGTLATAANDIMAQYAAGKINPGTAFDIDKWQQQQTNAAKNYYAKAGIPDSDAARHAIANIEAQADAMRDNARQSLLTSGIAATNANLGVSQQALQWSQLAQGMITQGLNAEQVRQNLIRLGLSADQAAQALTVAAVEQQAQQDQQFQQSQQSALQALILLQAMSKGQPTAGASANG